MGIEMANRKQRRATGGTANTSMAPTYEDVGYLITLFNQGRYAEAEVCARQLIEHFPGHGFGWKCLGSVLKSQGRNEESLEAMRKAAVLLPLDPQAHGNLGVTLKELGRLEEAAASFRRALKIKPDYAEVHSTLGNVLKELGRLQEAETSYRRALDIWPAYADAHSNLGAVLSELGRLKEAEASYRRALEINPDYAKAHYNLGNVLRDQERLDDATTGYGRALELNPYLAEAAVNLGNVHKDLGNLEVAEANYRRALASDPGLAEAHSNLLFCLNYSAVRHRAADLEEARRYGQMVAAKVKERFSSWLCPAHPKRLRVGLVSGDLHNHAVSFFLEGVVARIDPDRLELIAYAADRKEDELTARLKPYFSSWKSLAGLSDEAAAALIHADGVHLLLDLSGHTAKNRLPVFAWKPAPLQASWLGYFATTGVADMDYLLGDPYVLPPAEAGHYTEAAWLLPESYLCFTPPAVYPEILPLPALASSAITFGCFNNLTKINDKVVALWAQVLKAVPASRLLLKTGGLDKPGAAAAMRERFAAHGIEPDRLLTEGGCSRFELLNAYNRVDIALDPFPYPGGTTSVEGLWMGVPVITRRGDRFLSHVGESIMHNAGLAEWVAVDDDDYVAKAALHAADPEKLAALRMGLRRQILASPLFDAVRFARNFETALWGMWQRSAGEKRHG
jgi:predicted O-linked N-acetylglucosamine transferase (SPINDLY family)